MSPEFLTTTFVLLAAGVISVPIASRWGLGSVLGYLIAGIAIRPLLLGLGVDVVSIQHFAEFGVVMMLFIVGLELEPQKLWQMRARLIGLGGMQVGLTAGLVMMIALLLGFEWTIALAIGLTFSLSSTAIVLQTLNEKKLMGTDGGQASFSVLLFQDIAVIPMLALMPLLARPDLMQSYATADGHGADTGHGTDAAHGADAAEHAESTLSLVDGLGPLQATGVTIAAIGAVILFGIFIVPRLFRYIAMANLRELFVATALAIVIGIALLMTLVNVSPALGTFLAGVILANSEYKHELESDIDPFRGLLLGIFFISVGAVINFVTLSENFLIVIGFALGLMALKLGVLLVLARVFKLQGSDKWLFGLGLAQAGEFGFVLINFTVGSEIIPQNVSDIMLLIVTVTMMLTPLLFILYEKVIVPHYMQDQQREADEIEEQGEIILVGHGKMGGIINRMLRAAGNQVTVLDNSSAQLETLKKFGIRVFFGDASRPDLLQAAGIANAKLLIITSSDETQTNTIVEYVTKTYPDVHIIARAVHRHHVYDLYALGCRDIIRDTFDSSVRMGRSAYVALGMHPYQAQQVATAWEDDDKNALISLASVYDPKIDPTENVAYMEKAREMMVEREAQITGAGDAFVREATKGWTRPTVADVDAERKS